MKKYLGRDIIEAPRSGSRARGNKVRIYGKLTKDADGYDYDGITKIPSSMRDKYARNDKDFSDKLGPLHGYLRRNCGRPWNDVFSEISRNLGRDGSPGINHIISTHLNVAVNTWRGESGKVYEDNKYGAYEVFTAYRNSEFYVEPETGILQESPRKKGQKALYRERKARQKVEVIPLSETSEYIMINNIWYYQEFSKSIDKRYRRMVYGQPVYDDVALVIVTVKRQLGKKELKTLGVCNASQMRTARG